MPNMTKRGSLFGPCKDWGKKSRLIHGTRQFVLDEMTGWEKEERFEKWGGIGTLDKATYTVVESDSFSTLTQEDLDEMAPDGMEHIDIRSWKEWKRPCKCWQTGKWEELDGTRRSHSLRNWGHRVRKSRVARLQ